MLKFAASLSDEFEYAIVYWGQSNSRPWGNREKGFDIFGQFQTTPAAFDVASHLRLEAAGRTLTLLPLLANAALGNAFVGTSGSSETIRVGETLIRNDWINAEFRLGSVSAPGVGYGLVTATAAPVAGTPLASTSYGVVTVANADDSFTTSVSHGLSVGQAVVLSGTTAPSGVSFGVVYYAIYVATNIIKLAATYALAVAGTVLPIADDGTSVTLKTTIGLQGSNETVYRVQHGLATGDTVVFALGTAGDFQTGGLTAGTTYYVHKVDADSFRVASSLANLLAGSLLSWTSDNLGVITATVGTPSTVTVTWAAFAATAGAISAGAATGQAWVHRDAWKQYDNVRVLTPYIPEEPGDYPAGIPAVPGAAFPDSIESYEDAGLFLPLTFLEGIQGPGFVGTASAVSATTFSVANVAAAVVPTANQWAGGYVIRGSSWAKIATHTNGDPTAVFTLDADGWRGGTPAVGAFEVHLGHYSNNPNHLLHGFRYPNNDPMPCFEGLTGQIRNRPRARNTAQYGPRCGAMIEFAWRLSLKLGKRINVIHLGVNSAGQYLRATSNAFGFQGKIGWWDDNKMLDWTPANPDGCAARLRKLVATIAPAALTAEGNTKPLRILGIVGAQGEADALSAEMRDSYATSMPTFYAWLRRVIRDAGLSPYPRRVATPVVHQKILVDPYCLVGEFTQYPGQVWNGDGDQVVNAAIADYALRDGFFSTMEVETSPTMFDNHEANWDPLHFSGQGEMINGANCADTIAPLIDLALSFVPDAGAVEICNLALSNIGSLAGVTSIDPPDESSQAQLCAIYYPKALASLLELHAFSWSSKRIALVSITNTLSTWTYAYAVPPDVLKAVKVLAADAPSDTTYGGTVQPQPYIIEQDGYGNRVLYTNLEDAHLCYQALVVDSSQYPFLFQMALAWNLSAMIAGQIVKGPEGQEQARAATQMMASWLSQAKASDAQQRKVEPQNVAPWIKVRGLPRTL